MEAILQNNNSVVVFNSLCCLLIEFGWTGYCLLC